MYIWTGPIAAWRAARLCKVCFFLFFVKALDIFDIQNYSLTHSDTH